MSVQRRGRQSQVAPAATLRLPVSTSPSRQSPALMPSSDPQTKSISDAIIEGSHSALFTHSNADHYSSFMEQNLFKQAQQQQQQQLESIDTQYQYDDIDRMSIDPPSPHDPDSDLHPAALCLSYPTVPAPAAPTLPQHPINNTSVHEPDKAYTSRQRRKSYSSQSSDTDPRLFSGTGLGIDIGSRACSGGDAARLVVASDAPAVAKEDEAPFDITFRDDLASAVQPDGDDAHADALPYKTAGSNKSSIRSRDYKMAPSAAEMAAFLKMQLAEVARSQGIFSAAATGGAAAPLTPPTTVSGASEIAGEGFGRGRKMGSASAFGYDEQAWGETVAGARSLKNDDAEEEEDCGLQAPEQPLREKSEMSGNDHALTLDELLCESKYFIDYTPNSYLAGVARSDPDFSFNPSRRASCSVDRLRPDPAISKPAPSASATARSSAHAYTLTALPLYNLGQNPSLPMPRSSSAPPESRKPSAPLCFDLTDSNQELPGVWRSPASPQRALRVEDNNDNDALVHPALRDYRASPSTSTTRRASSLLALSVRQRPRSSRPMRTAKLVIPAKTEAERAAASDTSSSADEIREKFALKVRGSATSAAAAAAVDDFDDEAFFRELRLCYREVLCRNWWRRWASARTLKWIKVTDGCAPGGGRVIPLAADAEKRRPRRNFIARNVKSDKSYEKSLMRNYLNPAKGRGGYAWVQWARRLSIVGAIDVDEGGGLGRKDRLLPEEAGRGGLEFVEGFAVGRIALATSVVLLLSVAVLLIWTFLGPGDVLTNVGSGIGNSAGRVGTGALLAIFILMLGWLCIALWMFLSWICA